MARVHGDLWRFRVQDRSGWRGSRSQFVSDCCDCLLGVGHRAFGVEASSEDFKAHGVPPEGMVASSSHLAILVESGTEVTQPPLNDLSVIPWLPVTVEVSVARSVLQRLREGISFAIVGDSEFSNAALARLALISPI